MFSAKRCVNCEHVLALLTNIPPRHWEWQEDQRDAWVLVGVLQVSDVVSRKMTQTHTGPMGSLQGWDGALQQCEVDGQLQDIKKRIKTS